MQTLENVKDKVIKVMEKLLMTVFGVLAGLLAIVLALVGISLHRVYSIKSINLGPTGIGVSMKRYTPLEQLTNS